MLDANHPRDPSGTNAQIVLQFYFSGYFVFSDVLVFNQSELLMILMT